MRTKVTYFLIIGLCVSLSACSKDKPDAPAPATAPSVKKAEPTPVAVKDPKTEADEIFKMRCSVCHGQGGQGDGPGSAGLNPKPRDLTASDWQKSVTDEHINKIILLGGQAVEKSVAMPPNPDLNDKPEVVSALVEMIRALAKEK